MEDSVTEGEGAVYFVVVFNIWEQCWSVGGPWTRDVVQKEIEDCRMSGGRDSLEQVIRGVDVSEEFGV